MDSFSKASPPRPHGPHQRPSTCATTSRISFSLDCLCFKTPPWRRSGLIRRGLKYHRPGVAPHVQVMAERKQGEWRFTVQDNGLGSGPQYQERIFEMFRRLHHRDEYEDTGVGLAVCQKIVNQHGGHLWVESIPGKGSAFLFTLLGGDLVL
ncbi:hypothetical protein LAJ19_16000 (plasmid) [Deinococcus taeanensis]|nr:ATP-binding protein [Deinococcus taeanensis]UBV44666.1 hypothetical protein LAJ19_16000 [Deinococcus taeanensis]